MLIGMMGAGKTAIGRAVAERLDRPFRDSDADLEARAGVSGAEIAARDGVDRLHELEEELILDALASDAPTVVAAAGWVVESERCRRAMHDDAFVVWLDAPVATLLPRMAAGDHRRPLDRSATQALLERRRRWFERVADLRLDALDPPERLVEQVLSGSAETG